MKAEWEEGQSGSLLQEEAPAEETRKTEAVSAQAAPAAIVEDSGREAAEREEEQCADGGCGDHPPGGAA